MSARDNAIQAASPHPSPLPAERGEGEARLPQAASPHPSPLPAERGEGDGATAAVAAAPELQLPSSAGYGSLALPGIALLALAAAALVLSRRRAVRPRMVQVLESTSLGPKRQLVVARLGEELLVLGASEAGIALLATRAAGAVAPAVEAVSAPAAGATETDGVSSGAVAHLVALFKGKGRALRAGGAGASSGASPGAQSTAFEELLSESREDLELRRKLARGQAGSVR